jgi:hypothetical protein
LIGKSRLADVIAAKYTEFGSAFFRPSLCDTILNTDVKNELAFFHNNSSNFFTVLGSLKIFTAVFCSVLAKFSVIFYI